MGGEDVEMEAGEEEVRDMIVRFLCVVSFHSCTIPCMFPLVQEKSRARSGYTVMDRKSAM